MTNEFFTFTIHYICRSWPYYKEWKRENVLRWNASMKKNNKKINFLSHNFYGGSNEMFLSNWDFQDFKYSDSNANFSVVHPIRPQHPTKELWLILLFSLSDNRGIHWIFIGYLFTKKCDSRRHLIKVKILIIDVRFEIQSNMPMNKIISFSRFCEKLLLIVITIIVWNYMKHITNNIFWHFW